MGGWECDQWDNILGVPLCGCYALPGININANCKAMYTEETREPIVGGAHSGVSNSSSACIVHCSFV